MSATVRLAVALLLALPAVAGAQPSAADRDLLVSNRGQRTINELYASPSNTDDWGGDRLGDGTIAPQHATRLRLRARDCTYDFQAVYDDASREEVHSLNVCQSHALVLDGSRAVLPPGADGGSHRVAITDHAGRPIQQVFISPSNAGDWGDDLARNSVSVGDTAELDYRGECVADLRVVYDNRSAEERRGLDLCALGGVVVAPGWTTADSLPPLPADPAPASGQSLPVVIANHAGRPANAVFVVPAGAVSGSQPGEDVLGAGVLDNGAEATVTVHRPPGICRFDVRAEFGGKTAEQHLAGLDLCASQTITLPPRL